MNHLMKRKEPPRKRKKMKNLRLKKNKGLIIVDSTLQIIHRYHQLIYIYTDVYTLLFIITDINLSPYPACPPPLNLNPK